MKHYPSQFISAKAVIIEKFADKAFWAELPNGKKTVAFVEKKNAHLREELKPGDVVKVSMCTSDFDRARIDEKIDEPNR